MGSRSLVFFAFSLIISTFCFISSIAQECPHDKDKDWSYDPKAPNGPAHWYKKYPNCGKEHQSPINIVVKDAVSSGKRQRLKFEGYDEPVGELKIMNNGHLIHVEPKDNKERSVTYDDTKYVLKHFHFHWGSKSNMKGSETEINGEKSTMEVHLVHKDDSGKILVVGSLLEESNQANSVLDNILHVKQTFEYEGGKYEGEIHISNSDPTRQGKLYLEDIVKDKCLYFRYEGSFGFPPCDEGVTWLICRANENVKKSQMDQLFSLYSVKRGASDEDKCHMINIFRPVQPLNGRKVYK